MNKIDLWKETQNASEKWPGCMKSWYEVVGGDFNFLDDFYNFIDCLHDTPVERISDELYFSVKRIKREAPLAFKGKLAVYLSKIVGSNDYAAYYIRDIHYKVLYFIENVKILLEGNDYTYDLSILDVVFKKIIEEPLSTGYLMSKRIAWILNSRGIREAELQSTIINGIINAPLFDMKDPNKRDLFLNYILKALDRDYLIWRDEIMIELEYLLACPTLKHCDLIHAIVRSASIMNSSFVFEFCDEALTLEEDQIDEYLACIQRKVIKKQMTFAEATLEYNQQALEILRNSDERITPETIVAINVYENENPSLKKSYSGDKK